MALDTIIGKGLSKSPYEELDSDVLAQATRAERAEALASLRLEWYATAKRMCASAESERDALRADAERYRWLRDRCELTPVGADCDAAIDAAREKP